MRRGVPPACRGDGPGGRSSSATTRSSHCRAPAGSVASDLNPGGQRQQRRLVPGVTGGKQDRHRRAVPVDGGREFPVPAPRECPTTPRRRGLVPVTPFPGAPQCAGGPPTWEEPTGACRPLPAVQLPRGRVVTARRHTSARPAVGTRGGSGPIRARRRPSARCDLPIQPWVPDRRSRPAGTGARPKPSRDRIRQPV